MNDRDIIESQEQSQEDILNRFIDNKLNALYTCMPAIITSIDSNTQLASVQPIFKMVFDNIEGEKKEVDRPIINNTPIMNLRAGGFYISMPVKKGDLVLLFFSQRSIDKWLYTDGKTTLIPDDNRTMDINDCFALPCIITAKNHLPNNPDNLVIAKENSNVSITLKNNDEVDIKASKVNTITDRNNLGSASANTPLAKGDKTDSNFNKVFQWMTISTPFLAALGMAQTPPIFDGVGSGKVFSND